MKKLLLVAVIALLLPWALTGCGEKIEVPEPSVAIVEDFNYCNETWNVLYNADPNHKPERVLSSERTWSDGGLQYVEGELKYSGSKYPWSARWAEQDLTYLKIQNQVLLWDEDAENAAMDEYTQNK